MDDGSAGLSLIIVFVILLVIQFLSSGFYSGLDGVNVSQIETLETEQKKRRILFFLEDDRRFRKAWEILYSVVCLVLGAYVIRGSCAHVMHWAFVSVASPLSNILWWILAAFVILAVFLWLGVFLPTKLAHRKPLQWVVALCGVAYGWFLFLRPFSLLLDGLNGILGTIFRVDLQDDSDDVTEEEIISMVNEGHEQGVILETEAEMIHNIFELDDKVCEDIMTRRKQIVGLSRDLLLGEAMEFMLQQTFSRFPVYVDDIDHIVGMIHIKDAMLLSRREENLAKTLGEVPGLIRDPIFVPETQSIHTIFRTMKVEKMHMIIIVDEYGQTSGLVAMEDILEEIVGNIEDEHDKESETIIRRSDHSFLMSGMADLEDVQEALGISIAFEDIDTLNGFLISLIDKIPEDNERFEITYENYLFKILAVSNKTIRTVLAVRVSESPEVQKEG